MNKNFVHRVFLVFLVVFILSFSSYYYVWVKGDQTVTVNAQKDYVFLKENTTNHLPAGTNYGSATVVSYGSGLIVNALFSQLSTLTNETIVGFIYVYALNSSNNGTLVSSINISSSPGIAHLVYDLPAGTYEVAAFVDFYFVNYNFSDKNNIITNAPGDNGTVIVILPFPTDIFYSTLISGILSVCMLAYSLFLWRKNMGSSDI